MALNNDKLRSKIASFNKAKSGGKKLSQEQQERIEKIKKYIWKPEPGEQVIRIVPLQDTPDFPFIELMWHYDFNGDKINHLSPRSVNKRDPIVELADRLEKTRETWLKGRKMQPKKRTYVPIIIRGKEEEGVKFWGFGSQVYEKLASDMVEFDDITDLNNGNDIKVIFKTAEEVGKDFPETMVSIKPKSRPVVDPEHPRVKEIMDLITRKQPKIFEIYTVATEDELTAALDLKMENERNGKESGSAPRGAYRTAAETPVGESDDNGTVVYPTEAEVSAATAPATVVEVTPVTLPTSLSGQKAKKNSAVDFESQLDNLFGSNKK